MSPDDELPEVGETMLGCGHLQVTGPKSVFWYRVAGEGGQEVSAPDGKLLTFRFIALCPRCHAVCRATDGDALRFARGDRVWTAEDAATTRPPTRPS